MTLPGIETRGFIKRDIVSKIGRGRKASMTGIQLASMVGSDSPGNDLHFRHLVLELIAEGYPIASANGNPSGYFIAVTEKEVAGVRFYSESTLNVRSR